MKIIIFKLLIVILLVAVVLPAHAQEEETTPEATEPPEAIELPETYVFDSGAAFNYPEGWRLDETPAYVLVSKQPNFVLFVDFAPFAARNIAPDSDMADELRASFRILYGGRLVFDEQKIENFEIDDREAIRYPYTDDQGRNALLIFLRFSDGTFGMALASANMGEVDEALSLALISTFDSLDDEATEEPITTGACTVSTRARDTVQLHVGPGENRAVYAFMPAGKDFQVIDQAQASDSSLWWQLDKDEVAPSAAASEAWVAQDAVISKGDCGASDDSTMPTTLTPTPDS